MFFSFPFVVDVSLSSSALLEPSCHALLMQVLYIFYTDLTFQELESLVVFTARSCLCFAFVRRGQQRVVYSS